MNNDLCKFTNLQSLDKITIKKNRVISDLWNFSRNNSKGTKCLFCAKECSSFCNSHSIPRFVLKNITKNGKLCTPSAFINKQLSTSEKGLNNSGTFHLICNDCDSKEFAEYENINSWNKSICKT